MKYPFRIEDVFLHTLVDSMAVVRAAQRGESQSAEGKSDGTIVTSADKASDAAGKMRLMTLPPGTVKIHGEESGLHGTSEYDVTVYLDGLDGSMPFAIGASTSTVILAATDSLGEVIYCLVGEPATGRIWRAGTDQPTEACVSSHRFFIGSNETIWRAVHVEPVPLSRKTRVLIDSYPGFTRGGRTILTTDQLDELHQKIQSVSGLMMLGSNGMHHALVANGGKSQPAAITTAIGGPWDVAPVLLVIKAGGAARAFCARNGSLQGRNPLQVGTYDILVTGNKETVDILSGMLLSLRK